MNAANPSGVCWACAAIFRFVASPLMAASRSVANCGQVSGSRNGMNVETLQIAS